MSAPSVIERVKTTLVALKMPRALEVLDVTLRGIERGEIGAVEAIDALLTEELTTRENRRVRMAVQMARLSAIKTLAGFDFAFQPSLDRNRILARRFSRRVSSSVSRASMASTEPISPRSMPRRVTSRTSSARGIFKPTRTGFDALDEGRRAHRTPPRPARRRPTAA